MHAQRTCTVNEEALTSQSSWSSTRRFSAKVCKRQCKGKLFSTCESNSARITNRKNKNIERNNTASENSLERFAVTDRDKRSGRGTSAMQAKISKQQCITSRMHEIKISKVVQKDGKKTQTIVSACKKLAARSEPWKVWTTKQVDFEKLH